MKSSIVLSRPITIIKPHDNIRFVLIGQRLENESIVHFPLSFTEYRKRTLQWRKEILLHDMFYIVQSIPSNMRS
ncbi:MAG: hypothetical protein ACD_17C00019G0001 [uncultured bacterium]|nr:MAG: hypothetical protein ACD_17C00019G0001 [uncultured bacterium]